MKDCSPAKVPAEMTNAKAPSDTNRFDQHVFAGSIIVVVVAGSLAGWLAMRPIPGSGSRSVRAAAANEIASSLPLPRPLADFQLVDQSGRAVSRADFRGQFLVVSFAFTSCSLSCRAVNERMAEIQQLLTRSSDVRLVSLSIDPQTDTPVVLAKFADSYKADPRRWLFLTGDKAEMYRLIGTSFIPRSPELATLIPGGFANTDRIMLVDPQGNVYASFNGLGKYTATAVVAEIEKRRKLAGRTEFLN